MTMPRPEERELLKRIAARGGVHEHVATSSAELASELGVAQQTASRWILQLLESGHLERRLGARGQQVRLTEAGVSLLSQELSELEAIFGRESRLRVGGTVQRGDGEGAYYIRQPYYARGFKQLLGFEPFPGTLNVGVLGRDADVVRSLRTRPGLEITTFRTPERTFGGVTCFPATVGQIEAGVVFPHRTRHEGVVEVVSPEGLRKALGLSDGDRVELVIEARPERQVYNPEKA